MAGGDEAHDRDDRRWLWAGVAASAVLGLWITAPAWGARPPAGDDIQGQLVWNEFAVSKLFAHGRLDGWFPGFMVGYQKFLQYGPGFAWIVTLVRLATLGLVSTAGAVKVTAVLSVLTVGPAVAFLARSLGFGRRAAGIAAVLTAAVDSIYGLGPAAVFGVSLLPQQVAATWMFLALGAAVRAWLEPRRRWAVLLAVTLSMVVLTHPITLMVLAAIGVLVAVALVAERRPPWRGWVAAGLGGAGAALLGAFWLLPFAAHRDLAGDITAWRTPPLAERVRNILAGRFLLHRGIGWALLAGAVAFVGLWAASRLRNRPAPGLVGLAAVGPAYLVLAHVVAARWPHSPLGLELPNRGIGIAAVVALLPLAAVLAAAGERFGTAGMAVMLAGAVVVAAATADRSFVGQEAPPAPELVRAAAVLRAEVPPTARFASERDYPDEIDRTGVPHPDFWLARHSHRNTLNVFAMELSQATAAAVTPERIGHEPPHELATALARYGVTHVVTVRTDTADTFDAAPDDFRPVWRDGPLAVFAVMVPPGQPGPAGLVTADDPGAAALADARVVSRPGDADRLTISVRADAPVQAAVAVAYSPKWRARIDGRRVPVSPTGDDLLGVALPAGAATLTLDYGRDGWDRVGLLLSAATVLALAAAGLARLAAAAAGRSRQRTRRSSSSSRMSSSRSRTA